MAPTVSRCTQPTLLAMVTARGATTSVAVTFFGGVTTTNLNATSALIDGLVAINVRRQMQLQPIFSLQRFGVPMLRSPTFSLALSRFVLQMARTVLRSPNQIHCSRSQIAVQAQRQPSVFWVDLPRTMQR
jgi:hypothetical protein